MVQHPVELADGTTLIILSKGRWVAELTKLRGRQAAFIGVPSEGAGWRLDSTGGGRFICPKRRQSAD